MPVSLRPVCPDDEDFLYELFCQTMGDDLAVLDNSQRDAILRIQFKAQFQTYSAEFPRADHQIIMLGDRRIGRVLVERAEAEHVGVDIALLPEHRSAGIGRVLIQGLLDEAAGAGKPFRITVLKSNPAMHLYERLGFKNTGDSGSHFMLEWVPGK